MKTQPIAKPAPKPGMAVVWEDPKKLTRKDDANYLNREMISKYGSGPFRIANAVETDPADRWNVILTKDGEPILNEGPEFGSLGEPIRYDWAWLRPVPQDNLQIGELVTWASPDEIDDDVFGKDDVIQHHNRIYGKGPFTVAIQLGLCVYLVDNKGYPLERSRKLEDQPINRCFLKSICDDTH